MAFFAECSDNAVQDFPDLDCCPGRRMVDRHVEHQAAGEAGAYQGSGREGSGPLIVMDRTASENGQAEACADRCLSTCCTFYLPHDIDFPPEDQRLPLEENTDSIAEGRHDQRQVQHLLHRQLDIGYKPSAGADYVKRFIEKGRLCRFGGAVQSNGEMVDARLLVKHSIHDHWDRHCAGGGRDRGIGVDAFKALGKLFGCDTCNDLIYLVQTGKTKESAHYGCNKISMNLKAKPSEAAPA